MNKDVRTEKEIVYHVRLEYNDDGDFGMDFTVGEYDLEDFIQVALDNSYKAIITRKDE